MCIQWIASANCTGAVGGNSRNGCKGTHVAVVRRQVCNSVTDNCLCFFGSCKSIITLSDEAQGTVNAPCEVCGVDEDPEQMLLLKVFDSAFAEEWVVAFGSSHYEKCTEGKWRGRWEGDE